MRRTIEIAVVVAIVGILIALALPSYSDYLPRASVSTVLAYTGKVKAGLEAACIDGTFANRTALRDLGIPQTDETSFVERGSIERTSPNALRLRVVVLDIYGRPFFGLFQWKVIPRGSALEFEYSCADAKTFSSQLTNSTIDPRYLPASMRPR